MSRLFLPSLLLAMAFACGTPTPRVAHAELPGDFSGLPIPAEGVHVGALEDQSLTLTVKQAGVTYKAWLKGIGERLEADGWELDTVAPIPHGLVVRFLKQGKLLSLTMNGPEGNFKVYATLK